MDGGSKSDVDYRVARTHLKRRERFALDEKGRDCLKKVIGETRTKRKKRTKGRRRQTEGRQIKKQSNGNIKEK